jgi:hypothetical protein
MDKRLRKPLGFLPNVCGKAEEYVLLRNISDRCGGVVAIDKA